MGVGKSRPSSRPNHLCPWYLQYRRNLRRRLPYLRSPCSQQLRRPVHSNLRRRMRRRQLRLHRQCCPSHRLCISHRRLHPLLLINRRRHFEPPPNRLRRLRRCPSRKPHLSVYPMTRGALRLSLLANRKLLSLPLYRRPRRLQQHPCASYRGLPLHLCPR